MNSFFPYLLESSAILLLLFLFYFLVLRQKADPAVNRFFLLFSLFFALIVPALSIPLLLGESSESGSFLQPASQAWNLLPELIIKGGTANTTEEAELNATSLLPYAGYLYLAGVLLSLLLTASRIWKLGSLIRQLPFHYPEDIKEYKISPTGGKLPTFSFLHYIFWDDTANLKEEEAQLILRHELAHVRQHHSLDNLLLELLIALFWWNPLIYAYRYFLRQVHEHLADRYALNEAEPESYFSLMVRQTLRQANIPLVSQFFQHNTLNRIRMLQTKSSRTLLRATIGACVFATIFFVAACEDNNEPLADSTENNFSSNETSMNSEAKISLIIEEKKEGINQQTVTVIYNKDFIRYSDAHYIYTISDFQSEAVKTQVMNALHGRSPQNLGGFIGSLKSATEGRIKPGNNYTKEILEVEIFEVPSEDNNFKTDAPPPPKVVEMADTPPPPPTVIFEVVEENPTPVGGIDAFYKSVAENIKYPNVALEKGIQGRVFVQFVVGSDGSVSEAKVVKGIGAGCDAEALRVIKDTQWNPGKQRGQRVAVRMVIPIMFKP